MAEISLSSIASLTDLRKAAIEYSIALLQSLDVQLKPDASAGFQFAISLLEMHVQGIAIGEKYGIG